MSDSWTRTVIEQAIEKAVEERENAAFQRGVERGKFEQRAESRAERDQLRAELAAHDAALLRVMAAKLDGEGHPTNEYYRNWLMAEADRIEREESESKNGEENDRQT